MSTRTQAHDTNHALDVPSLPDRSPLDAVLGALPGVLGAVLVVAAVLALAKSVPAVATLLGVALVAVVFAGLAALPVAFVHAVGDSM